MSLILPLTFASAAKAAEDRPLLTGEAVCDIASALTRMDWGGWVERIPAFQQPS